MVKAEKAPAAAELESLRQELERADDALIDAIAERMRIARRIGRVKHDAGLGLVHPAREAAVVRRAGERARAEGLDDEAVREVFWRLIEMSRNAQADGSREAKRKG